MAPKKIFRPELATATDPRVLQTREALRAALLALLAHKPLDQITIREIAAEAGVGYITFFRHHPTKESLLQEIVADEIERLLSLAVPVLDSTDVKAAALTLCNYVAEHRDLWTTLLTGGAAHIFREQFIQRALLVAEGRTEKAPWLPAETAVTLVCSGTIELLSSWLKQDHPQSVEQIATIYERIIISPVVKAYETANDEAQ